MSETAEGRPINNSELVKKLAEACDAVGGVEKKGTNEAQRYKYVKAADIAKAIRHELFGRGIVLLQDEGDPQFVEVQLPPDKDGKPRTALEIRLPITFTVTDGASQYVLKAWGVARDSGDKGIWKAKTGALKYFLRGLGLIPDEKDDPEYDKKGHDSEEDGGELVTPKEPIDFKGIVIDESYSENRKENWYKVETEGGAVYVICPEASDSGRLKDHIGYQVEVRVERHPDAKGRPLFLLRDVRSVSKAPEDMTPALKKSVEQAQQKLAGKRSEASEKPEPPQAPPKPQSAPETPPEPQKPLFHAGMVIQPVRVVDVEQRVKKESGKTQRQYMLLDCLIPDPKDPQTEYGLSLFCWHKNTMFPHLLKSLDKDCVFGIVRRGDDETAFWDIEEIQQIGEQKFSNNQPV